MGFTLPFGIGKKEKTVSELEEETEQLEAENRRGSQELSLLQKQAAIKRLRDSGLTPGHFDWDWNKIVSWIKAH
jgi:hypothetical protein